MAFAVSASEATPPCRTAIPPGARVTRTRRGSDAVHSPPILPAVLDGYSWKAADPFA